MESISAHYDGKVFVPDEPVSVNKDETVRLIVVRSPRPEGTDEPHAAPGQEEPTLAGLVRLLESIPASNSSLPSDAAKEVDHYLYGTPKHES